MMYYDEERNTLWKDDLGMLRARWFIALLCVGTVLLCTAIAIPAYFIDKAACGGYASETGRETRFVTYTVVNWDCVTRGANGKWISTDQLRDVE